MKLALIAVLSAAVLGAFALQRPAPAEPLPVMQAEIPRIVIVAKREHASEQHR